jgi:hypothetical protein
MSLGMAYITSNLVLAMVPEALSASMIYTTFAINKKFHIPVIPTVTLSKYYPIN